MQTAYRPIYILLNSPNSMSNRSLQPALIIFAGFLLNSCSHPTPTTTAETPNKGTVSPDTKFPYGSKVDSLDGVPTHHFGKPLSAFKGLIRADGATPGMVSYHLPTGSAQEVRWFAKHAKEVPGVFYLFRDGRFASFQAVAYSAAGQAALTAEAHFLFGPGRSLGDRTEWVGERAWAVLSTTFLNGQNVKVLNVNSVTLQAAQEHRQQDQLKAENMQ